MLVRAVYVRAANSHNLPFVNGAIYVAKPFTGYNYSYKVKVGGKDYVIKTINGVLMIRGMRGIIMAKFEVSRK